MSLSEHVISDKDLSALCEKLDGILLSLFINKHCFSKNKSWKCDPSV